MSELRQVISFSIDHEASNVATAPCVRCPERTAGLADERVGRLMHELRESSYGVLQRVQVVVRDDSVYLYGRVPTYYLKQTAQEIARKCSPGLRVVNQMEVDADDAGQTLRSDRVSQPIRRAK